MKWLESTNVDSPVPRPQEARPATPQDPAEERRTKLKPLVDQLTKRKLSFRQFAYLSKVLAVEHGGPDVAFNHVSVSQWFSGKRNPSRRHRQVIARLLGLPQKTVDEGFDSKSSLLVLASPNPRSATIYVMGRVRPFEYPLTIRPDLDLSRPVVYENEQWEKMFRVYPANLRRHFNRARTNLTGWVPHDCFKPLIPHSQCLVLLNRPTAIPSLNDPEGFNKRIWFVALPSGEIDIMFMYREGAHLVMSKPHQEEQRFGKGTVDPLGYVTGITLFRLELSTQPQVAR